MLLRSRYGVTGTQWAVEGPEWHNIDCHRPNHAGWALMLTVDPISIYMGLPCTTNPLVPTSLLGWPWGPS